MLVEHTVKICYCSIESCVLTSWHQPICFVKNRVTTTTYFDIFISAIGFHLVVDRDDVEFSFGADFFLQYATFQVHFERFLLRHMSINMN